MKKAIHVIEKLKIFGELGKADVVLTNGRSNLNLIGGKKYISILLDKNGYRKYEKGHSIFNRNKKILRETSNDYTVLALLSLVCTPALFYKKYSSMKHNVATCSNLEKTYLLNKEDIKNGEMKEIKVNGDKDTVLLVNIDNNYYCVGPKCPHYSAPLRLGLLTKEYITCPWHDAKFDIKTGECINGPSFDDIPKYNVVVEGDKIYAYIPKEIELFEKKKICPCSGTGSCEKGKKKKIVIIGGGAATLGAIESFLKVGFDGEIIICSQDSYKPYDKPTLSKNISNLDTSSELYNEIKLKEDEYYDNKNITYMLNTTVEKVDDEHKKVYLQNGKEIEYDKILITTGLRPAPSPIQNDIPVNNLLTLNCLNDNIKIASFAKEGTRCVIIGSSFIACELTSSLKKKNVNISMVSKNSVPFIGAFGEKIGTIVLNILKEKNVDFYPNTYPVEYIIDDGYFALKNNKKAIHGVKLNTGEVIKCDYVIEALGCKPNSEFLKNKFKNEDGFILVDKHFKVKDSQDIYAAGDVCVFPYFVTGEPVNICHWNVAIQQGRIAANNMIKSDQKTYNFIPFFNTNIFGKNFRFSGYAKDYEKIIYEGDVSKYNFIGYFVKNNKVDAIVTLGNNKMAALNECLLKNKVSKVYELEGGLKNSDSMIMSLKS
ncbi:apoptosis-inducing factor, putative [Plasmodium chabaudi chabaudi]|uniref:Apoptosis-inducing factor, putative n=1 Tax=Plasmodium chabaudi chabaudi TaxID=31271 RepID=A0A4V0K588_PLACU|nr:apoptosis-inducing factor, putative [Plasmodium chabaudi chabaudi]VTZ67792.1 apoptosis-inducing factor, putative [Plasmodium chabaudi chabaudi]|eukprot:XP_741089.2 ferrodoxin reductase-like protein, putative [Plasmodium chabaudi chabaudi]